MAVAAFSGAVAVLVATSVLLSASLRPGSIAAFALAAYLLADAELVGLAEVLSPFHAVTRAGYLAGVALVAGAAVIVWWARGRPRPPSFPKDRLRELRRHPVVCVLAAFVLLALAYELAVGVTTPPNNSDAMWYHLVRAAAWRQHHAVVTIQNVNSDLGVNAKPPDAELQILFGLVLLGRDTFATIPQFLAECALLVSVFGIARRVGFELVPSLFAALVTATLSEVALQSVTTQNDLCVAAAVTAAAFFALGRRRLDVALAGLAVGLALGTKVSAVLALPAIALVVLAVGGMRRLLAVAASSAVGFAAFGAFIYLRHSGNAGTVTGVATGNGSMRAQLSAVDAVSTGARFLYNFVDLSGLWHSFGAGGADLLVIAVPAVALAVAAAPRAGAGRKRDGWASAVALAALLPLAAFLLALLGQALFDLLRIPANPPGATAGRFVFIVNSLADESASYFGPLGAFLVWPLSLALCVAWARGRIDRKIGALAAALPIYFVLAAVTLSYTPSAGRYFIGPVALVMPLTALVYRNPLLMRAVALVAVVFLLLAHAFSLGKPVGLAGTQPIWSLSRADAQAVERPAMRSVLERVAAEVPQYAHVGLVLNATDWSYPFYGSQLGRTVTYLGQSDPAAEAAADHLTWLIAHLRRPGGGGWYWRITRVAAGG